MFNRHALGTFVIALALPAYADIPPELMHRLEQYSETVHRFSQYPEVHTVEQHSGGNIVELQPLSNAAISFRMTANADVAYKVIGKLAGVTVVIDPDYRSQKITVALAKRDGARGIGNGWPPVEDGLACRDAQHHFCLPERCPLNSL